MGKRVNDCNDEKEERADDRQWIVSFAKLYYLFPNLKQIHFLNLYRFDNEVLQRLIKCIEDKHCKLEQIKFLYYDYIGSLNDYKYFYDPDLLDQGLVKKLKSLKWKMSYPKDRNGRKGFVIRIRSLEIGSSFLMQANVVPTIVPKRVC